jgi:crossover junction endodeoxyribonuclease RuvC
MIILGIDPGTATTGYGVIRTTPFKTLCKGCNLKEKALEKDWRKRAKCVDYGTIDTSPELKPEQRLEKISYELDYLIRKYQPNIVSMENVFFFKNMKTVMAVSQAMGVMMLVVSKAGLPIHRFNPLQTKMVMTGSGRADKKEVQKKVQEFFGLSELPKPDDAADALGIAVTCFIDIS